MPHQVRLLGCLVEDENGGNHTPWRLETHGERGHAFESGMAFLATLPEHVADQRQG